MLKAVPNKNAGFIILFTSIMIYFYLYFLSLFISLLFIIYNYSIGISLKSYGYLSF
jgi:hypothetical protein